MPVHFDDYETESADLEWTITEGSNAQRILSFLLANPETGYRPSEIATAVDVPEGSVGPTLHRLHERNLVRHKEPYWAISDDDRLAAYEGMLRSMRTLADRDGDDGWASVDPDEYEADATDLREWRRSQQRSDE